MNGDEQPGGLPEKAFDLVAFVVRQVVRAATDRWVTLAALAAVAVLGSVFLIRCPADELAHLGLGGLLVAIADLAVTSWICVGGWILSALVMFVAFVLLRMQHRRIQSQGSQLVRLRSLIDPDRLPAGDQEALRSYSGRAKSKFGGGSSQ
jgi:hypothetical protein